MEQWSLTVKGNILWERNTESLIPDTCEYLYANCPEYFYSYKVNY